jgi:hypothetical protein
MTFSLHTRHARSAPPYPRECMTRISERTLQEEEGNVSGE